MKILLLSFLVACDDNYPPELPLDVELTTCGADTDCVAVELGCCDHCNGGEAVAVNTQSVEEVEAKFSETCTEGTSCTEMGCFAYAAVCTDGACALEQEIDTGQ